MPEDLKIPPMPEYHDEPVATGMDAEWRHICDLRKWGAAGWTEAQAQARRADDAEATVKAMTETAAENSRVHVEMHNEIQQGRRIYQEALDEVNRQSVGWRDCEAERDALKARVAEMEADLSVMTQARNELARQRDREVLALRKELARIASPDENRGYDRILIARAALASTAQAGEEAERRIRAEESERIIRIITDPHNNIAWQLPHEGKSIHADPRHIAAILGTEPNP